jgi:hypothetical protein
MYNAINSINNHDCYGDVNINKKIMTKQLDNTLTTLYDSYGNQPIIKSLLQLIDVNGIPIGSFIDTSLGTYVYNLKSNRLKCFFDELNTGQIELTDDIIEQNDFLCAYFSTINYIIRTRSDEKIKCFARILKNLSARSIHINEFEDYTSIFNELSEREFAILVIKYQYEQKNEKNPQSLNPLQLTDSYWEDFKNEVCLKVGLPEKEFKAMLVRLHRTGCYNTYKGFLQDDPTEMGDTTELFKRLYELIY